MKKRILALIIIALGMSLLLLCCDWGTKDTEPTTEETGHAGKIIVTETNIDNYSDSFIVFVVDEDLAGQTNVTVTVSSAYYTNDNSITVTLHKLADGVFYGEVYTYLDWTDAENNQIACYVEDTITVTYTDADPAATIKKSIPASYIAG